MVKDVLSKIYPHLLVVVLFLSIAFVYHYPAYEGKSLSQSDISHHFGMSKEISDYREKTGGEEPLWTNSMFGGMPAYQISTIYANDFLKHIQHTLMIGKSPASMLFLALIGFYIALLAFGNGIWLSALGAIAFGFSSYFFIILVPGHNSKYVAMAYMAPVLASVFYAYRKNLLLGAALFGIALGLEIHANHFQITYYVLIMLVLFGLAELYNSFKEKTIPKFIKASAVLAATALLAIGLNFAQLYTTWEYGKYSMRGKSDLTDTRNVQTGGLDKDYATGWSYGKAETLDLLIPNFMGGATVGALDNNSETYKFLKDNNVPNAEQICANIYLYWGPQPSTSGPVYIGCIIVFLFVLGLFLIKGPIKWWLATVTVIAILLAWGKNFMFFTDIFFDYVPGYNLFRTVSMILIMVQFTMPLLAILGLKQIIDQKISKEEFLKAFKWAGGIVGGICLFFALFPGMFFDFSSQIDNQLVSSGWPQQLIDALRSDRKSLMQSDAIRSLLFIALSAGVLVLFVYNKVKQNILIIALGILVLADLWVVNKRYLNDDNYMPTHDVVNPFTPTAADLQILQDTSYYRVLNASVDVFNDASTSYFHKSIGGYHGAKLKRYQELFERQISKNNIQVLNMLNTKYIIVPGENKQPMVQLNTGALGAAWFVDSVEVVENADAEINALSGFIAANTAIVDKRFVEQLKGYAPSSDSLATINIVKYEPNFITYNYTASKPRLTLFSEIYYDKGWNAYVDGVLTPYFRANYVLRGMILPEGTHKVEFKFEPTSYKLGTQIQLVSAIIVLLMLVGAAFIHFRKKE